MSRRKDIIWGSVIEWQPTLQMITEVTDLGALEEQIKFKDRVILKKGDLVTVRGTTDRVVNGIVGRRTVKLVITAEGVRGWINWYESEPVT
jgi:hypothetical protein